MYTVYGDAKEGTYENWPTPKGKMVRLTTFKDANLYHCRVTGKAQSGIIHFIQQTPVEWYSKLQDTIETATFGSEGVCGRIATDQVIGMRATLMGMGVPIEKTSWIVGDNQSIITNTTIPSSTLAKRHNALSYHRIRWAVAAKIINFVKIDGVANPADALTKFLPASEFYPLLKPILFWQGETKRITESSSGEKEKKTYAEVVVGGSRPS